MELIHADANLIEQQSLLDFKLWDVVSGLSSEYESNDFELTVPETVWLNHPIVKGDFIYEPGTEWGGRVEGIRHVESDVQLTGPTWRGLLARKIISPPSGQAYRTITSADANTAINTLVGLSLGDLFEVESDPAGVNVSGQFRYTNLLSGLHTMLDQYGLRLKVAFANKKVVLSAEAIQDLSDDTELSQDYAAQIESEQSDAEAYNHVIALGSGELTDREVIERYRDDDGVISDTPLPTGLDDKQTVLDFPNAESTEELEKSAIERLISYMPTKNIQIVLTQAQGLNLGDLVGGRDRVTGLNVVAPVTQMIRRVGAEGETIEYKVG